jgi:hypothetical protein
MAADGVATRAIAGEVNCAIGTAAKWRVRYAKGLTRESSPDRISGQTAGKETTMSLARTLSSVVAAAISTAACGGDSAHATAIAFRCTNPKSGTTREVKVDYDRSTVDSFPAKITGSQIAWHTTL